MIFVDAEKLIKNKVIESSRIEYKEGFNPDPIIHTICAFANDIENVGGGYIVLGVENDNGQPKFPLKGLDISKIDDFSNALLGYYNQIEPRYIPEIMHDTYDGKDLLIIWCPAGYGRPYKVSETVFNKLGKYFYIRKLGRTIKARSDEEKILFDILSSLIPFDDRPNLLASINDLDINLLRQYYKNVNSKRLYKAENMSILELCEDLKIISGPIENYHPLNIGILLFTPNPEKFIKGARTEVVFMPYQNGKNMEEKIFQGPIDFQLRSVLNYLKNTLIMEKVIKLDHQAEAIRIFNYPFAALEELVTNAFYYKSYEINEPITIVIKEDCIEITSIPGIDISVSDDNIKNYNIKSKRYRNRRIGDFFKELLLTEGRNTGIPNALESLDENGSEPPEFIMDENRSYLTVRIKINEEFKIEEKVVHSRLSRTAIKENILAFLNIGEEISINSLADSLNYKGISKTFSAFIKGLIDEGYLSQPVSSGKYSKIKRIK